MKIGVVGLPNVGKSTLFNAITEAGAECANYPFCTIEPNVGVVAVPDPRLGVLEKMFSSKRVVPAVIEFVDIAGLVKGASKGEGLGNKFLSHIREVDAIIEVVRCFDDPNIINVSDTVDPVRDADIINTELMLADLESIEKRRARFEKTVKSGDPKAAEALKLLTRMTELASRGVACVLIKMPFRLAVFDSSAADGVREKFPEISEWYIGGHSLGGAISASYVSKHASDYKGLLLLGAYSTADLTSTALVTLSVYGSEDKVLNLDKYEKNRKNLTDLTEHIIPGGCHAYFGAYGPQSGDGSPTITPEEQISITAEAFCAFIAEH